MCYLLRFAFFISNFSLCLAELRQREEDRERQKMTWEMKSRQVDELRLREEELSMRMLTPEDEMRMRSLEAPGYPQVKTTLSTQSLLHQRILNRLKL